LIFSCSAVSSTIILVFSRISSIALSSLSVIVAVCTSQVLCISHTCVVTFKHFGPLIHNSTRESIVPILSTLALINLSTWYTFYPQETYHRLLLLLGVIL
jgi:hypothetical protein